jgi:Glycosyl hydrolase family 47
MTRKFETKNPAHVDVVNGKSEDALSSKVEWLLNSGIRIKGGTDKGALYGWKYLNPPSYPFVYSEITGYAISCFLWIYTELGKIEALQAAKDAAQWIIKNTNSESLLVSGYTKQENFVEKGDLSNQIYLFDNGMVLAGLVNLHKISKKKDLLTLACRMADSLIKYFFKGSTISLALVDKFYKPMELTENKWSTIPGAYHSKLSLGFLELSKLTGNPNYVKISNAICDFAVSLQKSDGRFQTNPHSNISYLHPHLYACEGLIYSGVFQSIERYLKSGIKGIVWAAQHLNNKGGLPRDSSEGSVEQSDVMCQLLRLLILCRSDLVELLGQASLTNTIDKLHNRILDFCITSHDINRGSVKYQIGLDSACSWCAMFCIQALRLWQENAKGQLEDDKRWMDFFA